MNFSLRSIEINARKICCQYFQSLNLFIKVPDGSQLWKVLISCQFCVVHPTKWSICGRLVQLTQAVNILVQGQLLTYNEIRHEDEEPGRGHQCRHCHSRGIVLHNIALHCQVQVAPQIRRSIWRFVITEKAPTRAFSKLKAPTSAFTFKTLFRHYAKCPLTLGK